MSTKEMVTLENLGGGAASEMFSESLEKLIENVELHGTGKLFPTWK